MFYVFGFDKVAVTVGDLYFHSRTAPGTADHGAEHGVRLEVRMLEVGEPQGSSYGTRPVAVREPVWRADLLETVAGPPGSHDRTHHHPGMRAWDGGERIFDPGLSADPVGWVAAKLGDLGALLTGSDLTPADTGHDDARQLRDAASEIAELVGRLLQRVRKGELGTAPATDDGAGLVRTGWM